MVVIVIAGPTAVGKTKVAIDLATKLNCKIINADSRQLYKEISIGTAKPNNEELNRVEHFLINSHSITDVFTTGDFEKEAIQIITNLEQQGEKKVIVCGGTGMYLNALINGLDDLPEGNEEIRLELQQAFQQHGIVYLQEKLLSLDEVAYKNIALENPQRLMRAIEVCMVSGGKYSEFLNKKKGKRNFETIKIALDLERVQLYERINQRVDKMMLEGLEEEARAVFQYRDCYALKTVGYSELFEYFDGKISRETAIDLIKQHSRNYAKRQLTWLRKDKEYHWFNANDEKGIYDLVISKL